MSRIFISYRRADSADAAGRIYDRLAVAFGPENVFKDVNSIPLGSDFTRVITEQMAKCQAAIVVIGRSWVDAHNDKGGRRLDDPADFVRIEVVQALGSRILVVPVLVGNATMPSDAELPISLRSLTRRHALLARPDPDFHRDMDRLVKSLQDHFQIAQSAVGSGAAGEPPPIIKEPALSKAGATPVPELASIPSYTWKSVSNSKLVLPDGPSDAARIHELAEAFDADWQPEDWARMMALVERAPPSLAPAVVEEFIVIDIQRRLDRQLTLPSLHSYLSRFPSLTDDPNWREKFEKTYGKQTVPAEESTLTPATIGRYPVNTVLATGGEAQVYLCYHPKWKHLVAVKWMRAEAAARSDWRERFDRQGELLKGLEHDHIVRVYDQDECQGRPFIVTEYIKGRTLDQYYRDVRPGVTQVVSIIADVASALGHAHRAGICHQDVKPSNILIDERCRVKLIDFGLAWFRPAWDDGNDSLGCVAGTLGYLSPEQANGGEVTARTDLFALGGVLYFLLTGAAPYPEPDPGVALARARACNWDRSLLHKPEIPVPLRRVCQTAMAPTPQERYSSAEELASAARASVKSWPWRRVSAAVVMVCVFVAAAVIGRSLSNQGFQSTSLGAVGAAEKPNLLVQVQRHGYPWKPLSEVVPLQDGDIIKVRFRVPMGMHASLVHVNGTGQLRVLRSFDSREATYEAIWPEPGKGKVIPPSGTELLLVCGRTDRTPTAEELQAVWDGNSDWPELEPAGQFLRIRSEEITFEGAANRDFDVEFPESDRVKRRLEQFRERLQGFPVLDGVAFRHK